MSSLPRQTSLSISAPVTTTNSPDSTSPPLTPPPKPTIPRSQPPRPLSSNSSPGAALTKSSPMTRPTATHSHSNPSSTTSSTSQSSSSRLPYTTPSTSASLANTTGVKTAPPKSSSTTSSSTSVNGLVSSSKPSLPPQTGASKMAAAAKRGVTGHADGALVMGKGKEKEPEDHPLSDKCLSARDYLTHYILNHYWHLPSRWRLMRPLGQGAYGLVIQVQDTTSSAEVVAIKCITKVFDKIILAKRALREITLLRHFQGHENITGLIDLDNVWFGYTEIYMYMEPMDADLHQIVRSGQPLSNTHIQFFVYQILRGMKYIHTANVIHRDLKPGNLLVNAQCELKICDFGLARGFRPVVGEEDQNPANRLTEYVATRWYRAPEVILSNKRYTTAIDVWSIGCILGELFGMKPLFKGKDYVDQMNLVLGILGTPNDEVLSRLGSEKACSYVRSLPITKPLPLDSLLPTADPEGLDLLEKLIAFDPSARIDVITALSHPYVSQFHAEEDEPSCPALFDKWEEVESLNTIDDLRDAITREIEEFREEVRDPEMYLEFLQEEQERLAALEEEGQTQLLGGRATIVDTPPSPFSGGPGEDRGKVPSPPSTETSTEIEPRGRPDQSPQNTQRAALGLSPRQTTNSLPPHASRSPSTILGTLPEDRSASISPTTTSRSTSTMPSRTSSRRTSGHSISRRPTSFLFSPLGGGGMTPLPNPESPIQSTTNLQSLVSGQPGQGVGGGQYYSGRRSRAPSTNNPEVVVGSLKPLIRQLSSVSFVDARRESQDGSGLGLGHGGGGQGEEVPPMSVSPSDAPPSEHPRSFR